MRDMINFCRPSLQQLLGSYLLGKLLMVSASGGFAVSEQDFSPETVSPTACHFQEDKQRRHLPLGYGLSLHNGVLSTPTSAACVRRTEGDSSPGPAPRVPA